MSNFCFISVVNLFKSFHCKSSAIYYSISLQKPICYKPWTKFLSSLFTNWCFANFLKYFIIIKLVHWKAITVKKKHRLNFSLEILYRHKIDLHTLVMTGTCSLPPLSRCLWNSDVYRWFEKCCVKYSWRLSLHNKHSTTKNLKSRK